MGSLKNLTFKGRFTRNQYRGGRLPKKGELGLFADLRRIGKKERGGDFGGGGWDPNAHNGTFYAVYMLTSFAKVLVMDVWQTPENISAQLMLFLLDFSVFLIISS